MNAEVVGISRASFQSIEGGSFVLHRADADPPAPGAPPEWEAHSPFPVRVVIGADDRSGTYAYVYADGRGICRAYRMSLEDRVWKIWGQSGPEFFQRFTGTLSEDGDTIAGRWDSSPDDSHWELDFELTYTRTS